MKQLKRRSRSQLTKNSWRGSYINMANSVDEKVDGTLSIRLKNTVNTFRPRAISRGGCGREPRMAVSELNFIYRKIIFSQN